MHFCASARASSSARVTPSRPRWNRFVARVDVVELQDADAVAVSAGDTLPAGLGVEDLLDLPSPDAHGLDEAAGAPIALATHEAEPRPAVPRAVANDLWCAAARPPLELARRGPQAVMAQPVPHCRGAALELAGDVADRHAARDERLEVGADQWTATGMAIRVPRPQPVLVHPVRDRRRVLAHLPRDRLDRVPGLQPGRQPVPVHEGANTSSIGGRKSGPLRRRMRARAHRGAPGAARDGAAGGRSRSRPGERSRRCRRAQ